MDFLFDLYFLKNSKLVEKSYIKCNLYYINKAENSLIQKKILQKLSPLEVAISGGLGSLEEPIFSTHSTILYLFLSSLILFIFSKLSDIFHWYQSKKFLPTMTSGTRLVCIKETLQNMLTKLSDTEKKVNVFAVRQDFVVEMKILMIEILSSELELEPEEYIEKLELEEDSNQSEQEENNVKRRLDFSRVILPPNFLDPLIPEEPRSLEPAGNIDLNLDDKVLKGDGIVTYPRF